MTRTQKIGGTVAVLVALLLGAFLTVDALARSALESVLSRTLGTETSVESLDLGILSGEMTLEGLRVANPEGFESPRFLTLRRARLTAGLGALFADTVDVHELTLEGMELTLEQRGTASNVRPILASVEEARARRAPEDEARFRIGEMVVREVTARVRLESGMGDGAGATVEIPEIRLRDVGSGQGGAVALSELAALTVQVVLRGVVRESGGLPGSLGELLRGQVGSLPGNLDVRWPDAGAGEGLQEQAEERLRELIPGQDGQG